MARSIATTLRASAGGLLIGGMLALSFSGTTNAAPFGKGGNYVLAPAKAESAPDAACKAEAPKATPSKATASIPQTATISGVLREASSASTEH